MAEKEITIRVPYESWAYLRNRSFIERMGEPAAEERLKRIWSMLKREDECTILNGKNLGGKTDGENVTWSIEDLKRMLDEEGLKYYE